jgi:5-methylcytosine-specific restriction endonuclease McrA
MTTCKSCREGKPVRHGIIRSYDRGCRCGACTNVASASRLRNKYKRVEAGIPLDVNHRARARRFGVDHQQINKLSVFERDGWRCGICGDPVDRKAEWPAPMSVSLDHIVPLSAGGGHVPDNVQCAHLRCNLIKNDGRKAATLFSPRSVGVSR